MPPGCAVSRVRTQPEFNPPCVCAISLSSPGRNQAFRDKITRLETLTRPQFRPWRHFDLVLRASAEAVRSPGPSRRISVTAEPGTIRKPEGSGQSVTRVGPARGVDADRYFESKKVRKLV